jgi:beta-galactosidase
MNCMFRYGVDYYPEHWPEERWEIDARLMAEAGMNVVRLAEFAWSKMEPSEGQFDFAWLDRALEILHRHGIQAILGTPTASPPPWVMAKDPTLYRVRTDGQRLAYGNRREYCPSHPLYHALSRKIVTAMAEHYHSHPAVIGWQIDNEFGDRCYCAVCAGAFQAWLQKRFPSLQALNETWGTVFWSHIYNDWAEIPTSAAIGGSPNPGLALDYARFCSDNYVSYQQMQVDILRQKCPGHFITHNFMGFGYEQLNYFDLARGLDLVTWDNYPRGFWNNQETVDPSHMALGHDAMRSLKHQNFWMMEQQSGTGGWETMALTPRPGEMRLWAYQAIARGADGMVFFRWRTARFGTEEYWHGVLDHDARPRRRYAEAKKLGQELKQVGEALVGAQVQAQAAMLLAYDTRWAFQIQPNNLQFRYSQHFAQYYRSLYRRQVAVELVSPEDDLTGYKLVIAPAQYILPACAGGKAEGLREERRGAGGYSAQRRQRR